ncbi:uncharacterized protein BROUX77_006714 [Berkeleyomyces rouxiae]|uniref:uncharacterized protein n=1 Tax=Berkeleyomyces rouxiae TaxID=2035830 RepID=UPI003B802FBA
MPTTTKRKRAEPVFSTSEPEGPSKQQSDSCSPGQSTPALKQTQQDQQPATDASQPASATSQIAPDAGGSGGADTAGKEEGHAGDVEMDMDNAPPQKEQDPAEPPALPSRKRRRPRKAAAATEKAKQMPTEQQRELAGEKAALPQPTRRRAGRAQKQKNSGSAPAAPEATATLTAAATPQSAAPSTARGLHADRNIDTVVLGDLCFRTWYAAPYSKELLGAGSGSGGGGGSGGTGGGLGGRRRQKPLLERLYVCPYCFKYAREVLPWARHVEVCGGAAAVPGRKVYVHPRREGEAGEWSVWEVDGEKDSLFCQNLSLFGKLFLETKSVFFDVHNFNFFLLVFTPPASRGSAPRITGFFSKEKMSWDNNNLACILVFPPWQRKGLGALLIGVSYEIARRERVLGGPEKPISDLGLKGYRRFWAGEIARWLLTINAAHGAGPPLVDVDRCSRDTWITPDDCLATLRDMGVVEPDEPAAPMPGFAAAADGSPKAERRVRISRDAVREWAAKQKISLERACDPAGFVEGYAVKNANDETT